MGTTELRNSYTFPSKAHVQLGYHLQYEVQKMCPQKGQLTHTHFETICITACGQNNSQCSSTSTQDDPNIVPYKLQHQLQENNHKNSVEAEQSFI